jgi:type II secretory pathway pseudopilin PulG
MTLIELILVMALLSVIMAIATPSLSTFFKGRRAQEEARRMLALTRYAHSEAISRSEPMEMWFNMEHKLYGLRPQYTATGVGTLSKSSDGAPGGISPGQALDSGQSQSGAVNAGYVDDRGRPLPAFHLAEGLELELDNKTFDTQGNVVIRFLPDGTIDEDSPANIVLRELGKNEIILARSDVGIGFMIVNK